MAKTKKDIQEWLNTIPDDHEEIFIADTLYDGGLSLIAKGNMQPHENCNEKRHIVIGDSTDNGGMKSWW